MSQTVYQGRPKEEELGDKPMAHNSMEQVRSLGESLIFTPQVLIMNESDVPCIIGGRT